MIEDNHYLTCKNYNNRECSTTGTICEVLSNPQHYLSMKNRCPHPIRNNYKGFFKHNQIIKRSYQNMGVTNHDEIDKTSPILRSRIELQMEYYIKRVLGGSEIKDININMEVE